MKTFKVHAWSAKNDLLTDKWQLIEASTPQAAANKLKKKLAEKGVKVAVVEIFRCNRTNRHFKVTYTSPKTGKQWHTITDNMPLIDNTKNVDTPTQKNLSLLKKLCKK